MGDKCSMPGDVSVVERCGLRVGIGDGDDRHMKCLVILMNIRAVSLRDVGVRHQAARHQSGACSPGDSWRRRWAWASWAQRAIRELGVGGHAGTAERLRRQSRHWRLLERCW